jgi:hypothetical protein
MQTPRPRAILYLLLIALLLAATALRLGHHITQSSFWLCYTGVLALGIVVRCLPGNR